MVGFLEVVLTLEADEQISGNTKAVLDAQGDGGADTFFLADHITELGLAEIHGSGSGDLGKTMVGDGVADQGGGGIGQRPGDLERVARNGGGLRFHGFG